MKLTIVILCWNDRTLIGNCLQSIYSTVRSTSFEIIVSDNGSTDGSVEFIREHYPGVNVIENGKNLRFAKANNVGIRISKGEYVLILNPDTVIHESTIDELVRFADRHPETGAFGCKVLNSDGTYQESGRPLPTIRGLWITALYLRALGRLSSWFDSDTYAGWKGRWQRTVGYLSGCFILARGDLIRDLGGFDEQFFYYYEDIDLCRQIWESGSSIVYVPTWTITHIGGQSTKIRFPASFAIDSQITLYLYFYKHSGRRGVRLCKAATLTSVALRCIGYSMFSILRPSEKCRERLSLLRILYRWNRVVDPVRLVEFGEEPDLGFALIPHEKIKGVALSAK